MSPENVKLSIIGGMVLICGLVFLIPSTARNRARQGSNSNSAVSNSVEDATKSLKESLDSLTSSDNIIFGKSKSSSYGSMNGGSRRKCKKGGRRKTKGRK